MARATWIADALRDYQLKVEEVRGWRTRGSESFAPAGVVVHHTAGSSQGNAPSLNVCINGRSDLPGPLCQVLVGRDGTCYVIAAGRANHAGAGTWAGLRGNGSVFGIEAENVGTVREPWKPPLVDVMVRASAALIDGLGRDPRYVCFHREWAPGRKVDPHTLDPGKFRAAVAAAITDNRREGPFVALTDDQQKQLFEAVARIDARVKQVEDLARAAVHHSVMARREDRTLSEEEEVQIAQLLAADKD